MTLRRVATAALAVAIALPAFAYILPTAAILRHLGQRRAALELQALEVRGSLELLGPDAAKVAADAGVQGTDAGAAPVAARFLMKVPGRCRLELTGTGAPEAERPFVAVKDGAVRGKVLDRLPAAVALVRGACTLLAVPSAGDASGLYAAALGRRGVAVGEATLGRFDGRVAYVIGGKPRDARPMVFVDKDGFQPLRLLFTEGGTLEDVRLLGWGSPTGGDWFPRAVEVAEGDQLRLRFTTEKASANPRALPDTLF